MKLLLDENIPIQLRDEFSQSFDVYTVRYMGWNTLEDSDLLVAAHTANFNFLITVDKRLHRQHNLENFDFQVITLATFSNRIQNLIPFIPLIEQAIEQGFDGKHLLVTPSA